jgi:iron(III) transport system substrate-binding protein
MLRQNSGKGRDDVRSFSATASRMAVRLAMVVILALTTASGSAGAQGDPAGPSAAHPWIDSRLLPAARAEGAVVVYSSTNEQEALPLFKVFEDATGIKVQYVRASDTALFSRMTIEYRAGQPSFDIIHNSTAQKLPSQMLAQIDPPEAQHILPAARGRDRRWYGVYAIYNLPAYNTEKLKASDLPKSYEDFATRREWAGKVAIDGTDNEWLKGMFDHYGEQRATEIIKMMVATLKPVITDGHLALARSVAAGEYWLSLNNYVNLSLNMKLAGGPIEIFALDPVSLYFSQVAVAARAPHPNAARLAANFMLSQEFQQLYTKYGRLPTRNDVATNPPGVLNILNNRKIIPVQLGTDDDRKWQRTFETLFKPR